MTRAIRIGCGTGFWGDTPEGAAQLVHSGDIDYLILDYLAEITMSILARLKSRDPAQGYASDFVTHVMTPLARDIAAKRIKVVTNAGGLNPIACRDALARVFAETGVDLKVALVLGDDLSDRIDELRPGMTEMATGAPPPARLSSMNAYLGAFPIAAALAQGADIVLTGRVVDSALALGPLIHEFGWSEADHDRLAGGSLAGHVIECGPQATGGIFTDWRAVSGWEEMGFPIARCEEDGSFELTKPAETGGLVTPETVAEQVMYEIGDPASYILPDVVCDFSSVTIARTNDGVRVRGARGRAPTRTYKVCATYPDGYRAVATMTIAGRDAAAKAHRVGEAILSRVGRLLTREGHEPFSETLIEVLGGDASFGVAPEHSAAREVVLRIAARHDDKSALGLFAREIYPSASSMAQGITGFAGGRPAPQPVVRLYSCLLEKSKVAVAIDLDGVRRAVGIKDGEPLSTPPTIAVESQRSPGDAVRLPLLAVAHGRSGDKGDIANIGILARDPDFLPVVRSEATSERVKAWLGHVAKGPVERHEWPGLRGVNFILHDALGGGGVASLRNDPQGKTYAQVLLEMPIAVPSSLLDNHPSLADWSTNTDRKEAIQ